MARVTFSLSDDTVAEIRRTAARLRKPQSHVVRDAGGDRQIDLAAPWFRHGPGNDAAF